MKKTIGGLMLAGALSAKQIFGEYTRAVVYYKGELDPDLVRRIKAFGGSLGAEDTGSGYFLATGRGDVTFTIPSKKVAETFASKMKRRFPKTVTRVSKV